MSKVKNSQDKKEGMVILTYIWMVLRVPVILGILIGFFLLPLISQPKIPYNYPIQIFNLIGFAFGVLIIVLSSIILIKNAKFSPPPKLKLDPIPQDLVTTGFYKYIRHPIYTGGILAYLFYSLLFRALFCILLSTPLFVLCLYLKARQEERDLKKEFGEVYNDYIKKTGMLLPKIKRKLKKI